MQLVEAGKLTLDSRLSDFITGLPEEWQSLTSRQLLGHASGLPDYMSQPAFDVTRDYEPAEILGLIKNLPLAFKPGTQGRSQRLGFLSTRAGHRKSQRNDLRRVRHEGSD
jgi:D-alanyl-D-alanine carboxypeptidase